MTHCLTPQRIPRPRVIVYLAALAGCIISFGAALAQNPVRVTIDAARCVELESPDERLACFDSQVDDASSGERIEPGSQAPPDAGAPPRESRQASTTVIVAADARSSTEWVGTIASLKERTPNRYLITLDSGEVWQQQIAERYPLRVGQRVRIYPSKWGNSKRLQADGVKGFIQVERVP